MNKFEINGSGYLIFRFYKSLRKRRGVRMVVIRSSLVWVRSGPNEGVGTKTKDPST